MQLVDQFYQWPGRCFFTMSSSVEKPILDTGHIVDGEGRVYIGGEFLEEACRLLGWTPPEVLELATADRDDAIARAERAEAALAERENLEAQILAVADRIRKPFLSPQPVAPFSPPYSPGT